MLKRIVIAALIWPLLALAQSYPSPTFNNLTVQGTFTSSGNIGLPSLAAQAANTVVANFTALSTTPTAVVVPSCSATNSALKYTSGTGLSCGTTFGITTGTLAQFASTTSAQLASVISDETGSGSLVFGTSPSLSGASISGGGGINGVPIGGTTPSSGAFTTLSATTPIPVASGGTGANSAATARTNLGAAALAGISTQQFNVQDATTANNAVAYDQALGLGQTWTDVHTSRALGTTYTNSTGRPIMVIASAVTGGANGTVEVNLNGVIYFGTTAATSGTQSGISFIVPPSGTYVVQCTGGGSPTVGTWGELR